MEEERVEGQLYDSLIICVDRHTGWIIAIPTQKVDLTAEKMAKLLLNKWLDMGGGIPSIITSDRGSPFIGRWFKAMCARLGIRQAFSQAYRSNANGRAERAGRQVLDWLAKIKAETEFGWVEALPIMLRQYHDAVGESGFSPYEVVFGRYRNLPGIPRPPPEGSEDALVFLDRQSKIDEVVANTLNMKHERMIERVNRNRPPRKPFEVGTKVWVYKHKRVGGYKMEPRWWGPAEIISRNSHSSYTVTFEGGHQEIHIDDLKEYEVVDFEEEGEELMYTQVHPTDSSESEKREENSVESIQAHRMHEKGWIEFLVKWQGKDESENSWIRAGNLAKCARGLLMYCGLNGIALTAIDLLPNPYEMQADLRGTGVTYG